MNFLNSRSLPLSRKHRIPMSTTRPPPSAGANSTPEARAALFTADPRIHYSRESGTWRLENEDGSELEYVAAKGTWVSLVSLCTFAFRIHSFVGIWTNFIGTQVDEDLLRKQQAAYSIAGVDEEVSCSTRSLLTRIFSGLCRHQLHLC